MSKQIKQNCVRIVAKLESRLEQLMISVKMKRTQIVLEKLLTHIINDFKFFKDDFKIIIGHLSVIQSKSHEKDTLISQCQTQLLNKNVEKKNYERMMKSKYQKLSKQYQFSEFTGKSSIKPKFTHTRCKSQLIKKELDQLQKDIIQSNKRVCNKVKQLKNQIQNQQLGYLTLQNNAKYNNFVQELNLSNIADGNQFFSSPSKNLEKQDKLKNNYLGIDQNITFFKTKKKQLASKQHFDLKSFERQRQPNSAQTVVVINKRKKQQLAQLIAEQTKIIGCKERYFSTFL